MKAKHVIWLPDRHQTATVEWYTSGGRATGINEIREEWIAQPVDPDRYDDEPWFGPRRDRVKDEHSG